jgi:hypothetical protein
MHIYIFYHLLSQLLVFWVAGRRESPRQAEGTWALKWRSICAFKDGECRGDADTLMKAKGDESQGEVGKSLTELRWNIHLVH